MKTTLFIMMLFIGGFHIAAAQSNQPKPRKTAEQRTEAIVEQMKNDLSLDEAQMGEIHELVLLREKKRDAGRLTDEEEKEFNKLIKEQLTIEQKQKLEQQKKAKKKKR